MSQYSYEFPDYHVQSPTRPSHAHSRSFGTHSSSSLLPQNPTYTASQGRTKSKKSYFRTFCTTFRLHILYTLVAKSGRNVPEDEKVAFYRSRRLAFIRSLIHLLPFIAAGTLIYFNIWQYYIGGELAGRIGEDPQKLAALQFAAKLHELLMLASIGTIVFAYIRFQMAFGEGVTIGTIFAGQQFQNISNLWSMEFWSTVYSAREQKKGMRKQKWFLVTLIVVATLLGVSVGPSSANLMRPRLDWWPAGGSTFYLGSTEEVLYPRVYDANTIPESCSEYTGDDACPYGGFDDVIGQLLSFWPQAKPLQSLPESLMVNDQSAVREMKLFHRNTVSFDKLIWGGPTTTASVGLAGVADGVTEITRLWSYAAQNSHKRERFRYRVDASFKVDSYQPLVETYCMPFPADARDQPDSKFPLQFANVSTGIKTNYYHHNDNLHEYMSVYNEYVDAIPTPETTSWLQNSIFNGTTASITWANDSQLLSKTNSSLLALVALPASVASSPQYLCCNVNIHMNPVALVGTRNDPKVVKSVSRKGTTSALFPTPAWANLTNPYIPSLGMDAFAYMAAGGGVSNATSPRTSSTYRVYVIESIIAFMLANGLSRMPYRASLTGTLKGMNDPSDEWSGGAWVDEFMPKTELGYGGNAYEISPNQLESSTKFTVKATCNGYAYSSEGITQKAALAVLILYCFMAAAHTLYNIIISGWSSGTWDTTPELTALAINSDRSAAMHNTGAGIYSMKTMEQNVQVRSQEDRLEMVFFDTELGGEIVRPGRTYH